jgi:hypothetical protein
VKYFELWDSYTIILEPDVKFLSTVFAMLKHIKLRPSVRSLLVLSPDLRLHPITGTNAAQIMKAVHTHIMSGLVNKALDTDECGVCTYHVITAGFALDMLTWRWQTIDCLFSLGLVHMFQYEVFKLCSLKQISTWAARINYVKDATQA